MRKKHDSTEKREKKTVSWNDQKTEGKINESSLETGTGATPYKRLLEEKISKLKDKGYTELEATALVGKAQTPSGDIIITNSIYYASKEEIENQKLLREQKKQTLTAPKITSTPSDNTPTSQKTAKPESEKELNQYSFFGTGAGLAALAVVATLGFMASRR